MSDKKQEDEIRAMIFANLSFLVKVSCFFFFFFHTFEKGEEKLESFLVDYDIVGL